MQDLSISYTALFIVFFYLPILRLFRLANRVFVILAHKTRKDEMKEVSYHKSYISVLLP